MTVIRQPRSFVRRVFDLASSVGTYYWFPLSVTMDILWRECFGNEIEYTWSVLGWLRISDQLGSHGKIEHGGLHVAELTMK